MCGIFGIIVKENAQIGFEKTREIVDVLFRLSESRGKESAGIAIKNLGENAIHVFKKSIRASELIQQPDYRNTFRSCLETAFNTRKNSGKVEHPFAITAHARLVTNGSQDSNDNNQPVVKDGVIATHNGIVTNVEELWKEHPTLSRSFEVDTEFIASYFRHLVSQGISIESALQQVFLKIYGYTSFSLLFDDLDKLVIATNNGSLYTLDVEQIGIRVFSSECYFLKQLIKKLHKILDTSEENVTWLPPASALVYDLKTGQKSTFNLHDPTLNGTAESFLPKSQIINHTPATLAVDVSKINLNTSFSNEENRLLEYNLERISALKRCTRCLLPETFPFIHFDENGICNYCHAYQPIRFKGKAALEEYLEPLRSRNGKPDCIVTFSGGRDSSFGLHYLKEEMNMHPIAYTYDWGMVTDLARRNQARLCDKLGVELIIVSADITRKRENIRKNVSAWLKKPHLGTIPLFMAGDKQYFYFANQLKITNKTELVVLCENLLETTNFKYGFCGIAPNFGKEHTYSLSPMQKASMLFFYGKEYLLNPAYLNSSLLDTLDAFKSYYFIPHHYLNIFQYIRWDENIIEKTLFHEYDWEMSPDTTTTWRIGDGTAAFYNYIYYTLAGFSEFDTFRSNQIREGMISREEALHSVNLENRPRYESIKWYLNTIHLPFEPVIRRINELPKLYK